MAYATISELAAHLGLSDAITPSGVMVDTARNSRYQLALDTASTAIESDTGRVFTSTTATKSLISRGGYILHVPDLVSVTTIKTDEDDDGIFEETLLATDYELGTWHEAQTVWPYEFVNRIDDQWPIPTPGGRRRLIQITGVWGWPSVPAPIKQATLLMAARQVARGNASLGVQGVSDFGPFSIRNTDPDYQALVAPYRITGVA